MTIIGTSTAEHLIGTPENDHIEGLAGDDFLEGLSGNDALYGNAGQDEIQGGDGDDVLYGNEDDDYLDGEAGNDTLYGGDGNDTLLDSGGSNILDGGAGDDYLCLEKNAGSSTLIGGAGNDELFGYLLDDYLQGDEGNDRIYADEGDDKLYGGAGEDLLVGNAGNDFLDGGDGENGLDGGDGDDSYIIRNRHDFIYESSGNDTGLIYVDFYKTNSEVENWKWAEGVQKLPYWLDALLPFETPTFLGLIRESHTFYYCFPSVAPSHFSGDESQTFIPFNEVQKEAAKQALAHISTVANLKFVETADSSGRNTIVFGNTYQEGNTIGLGRYPHSSAGGSDVLLDHDYVPNLSPSDGEGATTLIHEIGHAIGLQHTHDGPALTATEDKLLWSKMSYADDATQNNLLLAPLDIAALQYLYGVGTARSGDDFYKLSTDMTNLIWDGGGKDTIDGSALDRPLTLFLEAGYWGHIGAKSSLITAAGQITVNFGTAIENAYGGMASDVINGNAADNHLVGNAGNDALAGYHGNDVLDGGVGVDTAIYGGKRLSYNLEKTAAGYAVVDKVSSEGNDILVNIERIRYVDTALALDINGNAGQAYRLYQAAFGREADLPGLGWHIKALDNGASVIQISQDFINSAEYRLRYGEDLSDGELVRQLYRNALNREPEQAGYEFWTGALGRGELSHAQVLHYISESEESQVRIIGAIQNGIEYQFFA